MRIIILFGDIFNLVLLITLTKVRLMQYLRAMFLQNIESTYDIDIAPLSAKQEKLFE